MSPAVRLVTLLVVAAIAGTGRPTLLAFAATVTIMSLLAEKRSTISAAFRALLRLRWLLASIAAIYLWFTPGAPLAPAWGDWSPTLEGLEAGALRAGVLAVIAVAAAVTVNSTPRDSLAGGLIWLLQPLAWVGVPTETFAVRLSLTLDRVLAARESPGQQPALEAGGFVSRAADLGARLFLGAERDTRGRDGSVDLAHAGAPPMVEWLVPGLVAGVASVIAAL